MYAPEVLAAKVAREAQWLSRIHSEILKGSECFLDFLHHPRAEIRLKAAYILSLLPERKAVSMTRLRASADSDSDPMVREAAQKALTVLCECASDIP
jgi:hypothetical protein